MNVENEIQTLSSTIERLSKGKAFLEEHRAFFESLEDCCGFWSGAEYNLSDLNRENTLAVIKHFGGKWDKSYRQDKADYTRRSEIGDPLPPMCIFGGTPPETCRIVVEEVEIPAQKIMKRRLVCTQAEEVTT